MWVCKKILTGLALVVGLVSVAGAAEATYENDVYPLVFGTTTFTAEQLQDPTLTDDDLVAFKDAQLKMWKRLMKYKLFATGSEGGTGIFMQSNAFITDSVGYVGSAKGNLETRNTGHALGGPILFGGSFKNESGYDSLLTGPVRFLKNFGTTNQGTTNNYFAGNYCFDGGYNQANTQPGLTNGAGNVLSSSDCQSTDVVYAVDTDLDVPVSKVANNSTDSYNMNNSIAYIHVPPTTDSTAYIVNVKNIDFNNQSKLYVVMPPEGRLTKIFVSGTMSNIAGGDEIAVIYAEPDSWNGSAWTKFGAPVDNADYAGNLLFYLKNSLNIQSGEKTIQGTFISLGDIFFGQHSKFAGQLIAKKIEIDHDFQAKDFKYVPFNPPQISLSLAANDKISEDDPNAPGYSGTPLNISLSKAPDTDVKFDYCFEFLGTEESGSNYATQNDVDMAKIKLPICGTDTLSAAFKQGSKTLTKPIKIWVNDDDIIEKRETFKLNIFHLTGGTFSDNSREWPVTMSIYDNDKQPVVPPVITPKCPADPKFTILEDGLLNINSVKVPGEDDKGGSYDALDDYLIKITALPTKGALNYGGVKITATGKEVTPVAIDNNYLQFKPAPNGNGSPYATVKYSVSFTNEDGVETTATGCTWTINVTPVNDAPVVKNYAASVREDVAVGFMLPKSLGATDVENDKLTYKITANNGASGKTFEIVDGFFYVREKLDYESTPFYPLIVEVSDGKDKTTIVANITVIDVNEPPTGTDVTGTVHENAEAGKLIAYVAADDPDEGYKNLKFEIVETDIKNLFAVESKSAEFNKNLTVKGKIDYETIDKDYEHCTADGLGNKSCSFTVRVTDNGSPALTKDIKVTIAIIDDNEAVSATGFTVAVDENVPEGTKLGKSITVTDEDDETFKYSIFSGNGEKIFKIDENTGAISVVGKIDFENYDEGKAAYKLVIEVKDARATGSNADTAIVNITINDVNEPPSVKNQEFAVYENKTVGTVVGTVPVEDEDYREVNRKNVLSISGDDAKYFEIDEKTGVIKTKEVFDYEARKQYKFKVTVEDQDGFTSTADVVVNVKNVPESSAIVVDRVETGSGAKAWSKDSVDLTKTVIYTNEKNVIIKWSADGKAQPDTLVQNLKEGFNTITLEYCDKTKDACTKSEVVVFVSTKTPEVSVSAKQEKEDDKNIFTIAEEKAPGDTSIYVSSSNSDLVITVKEPVLDATYTDSTCNYTTSSVKVNTALKTVTVPQDAYNALNEIVKEAPTLDVAPSGDVTYSAYNDDQVKITYTQKTQTGKTIYVSYVTDKNGDVVKQAVIGPNGKIDSVEVMTVSYKVSVDGEMVTVSYEADAVTGQALKTVANNTSSNSAAGSTSGSTSGSTAGKPGSGSTSGSTSGSGTNGGAANGGSATTSVNKSLSSGEILFTVSYEYESKASNGNDATVNVAYTVNQSGKVTKDADGNIGYQVTYTYTNVFGNSASESVFIVVDVIPPVVKILSPTMDSVLYTNDVDVVWTVDLGDGRGPQIQDSLTSEGLEAGKVNEIIRFYRDKAGNEASDVVYVMVKNTKDVDIRVEKPVTIVTREDVEKFYAEHKPEEGQTFAISIYNPHSGKEVETQIGGSFKTKTGSGESTYPDSLQGTHLGPTLGITTKVPTINSVAGLATLDDLVGDDGMILLDKVDAAGSKKVSVDEYVHDYCTAEFQGNVGSDISMSNLYKTVFEAKIWVYTSLGQFVDEFHFSQDLNDPSYISDGGVLKMYFEQKPDENGDLRTKDGRLYATGAYIYKTEMNLRSTLQCTLPPTEDASKKNTMGAKTKTKEDMLKPFGYKRPSKK